MKKVIQKVLVIRVEISVSPHIWGEIIEIYVIILCNSEDHIRGQRIKKTRFSPFLRTYGAKIFMNYT